MAYWATVAARLTQAGPLRGHGKGKQGSENGAQSTLFKLIRACIAGQPTEFVLIMDSALQTAMCWPPSWTRPS